MSPDPAETLACILENLEQVVFPLLGDEHAMSVARCTSILIRSLVIRLEQEPAMLAKDSLEKRATALALADSLSDMERPEVVALRRELMEAGRQAPLHPVPLGEITAENDRLRELFERIVDWLYSQRESLGETRFREMRSMVRRQLRAQLDRDEDIVRGPLGGLAFPY